MPTIQYLSGESFQDIVDSYLCAGPIGPAAALALQCHVPPIALAAAATCSGGFGISIAPVFAFSSANAGAAIIAVTPKTRTIHQFVILPPFAPRRSCRSCATINGRDRVCHCLLLIQQERAALLLARGELGCEEVLHRSKGRLVGRGVVREVTKRLSRSSQNTSFDLTGVLSRALGRVARARNTNPPEVDHTRRWSFRRG